MPYTRGQSTRGQLRLETEFEAAIDRRRSRLCRGLSFACLVMMGAALFTVHGVAQQVDKSIHDPSLTALPDANAQMQMHDRQSKAQDFAAANAERKKQIANDSAKLLKLATELKTEMDKTSKDTLSMNVIRKADEIERLAHNVKEKMKLTVGGG